MVFLSLSLGALGAVQWSGITVRQRHHLPHDGHVELAPGELGSIASCGGVVVFRELGGAWPAVAKPTPTAHSTKVLNFALFLQVNAPLVLGYTTSLPSKV